MIYEFRIVLDTVLSPDAIAGKLRETANIPTHTDITYREITDMAEGEKQSRPYLQAIEEDQNKQPIEYGYPKTVTETEIQLKRIADAVKANGLAIVTLSRTASCLLV